MSIRHEDDRRGRVHRNERNMFGRLCILLAAAALAVSSPVSGEARADGVGLLDFELSEADEASMRSVLDMTASKADPARLPLAALHAAEEAVPGFRVREATLRRFRPTLAMRQRSEFYLKGRDAAGRDVTIRVGEDGSRPAVTRAVPLDRVPGAILTDARTHAAKHGYKLTTADQLVRTERVMGRKSEHHDYYLKGTHPDKPGVTRMVWTSSGRSLLRSPEEVWWITLVK